MEIGNMSKRQQPDHKVQRPQMNVMTVSLSQFTTTTTGHMLQC